jgi:hypothetical protein
LGGGNIGVTMTVKEETKIWVINSDAQEVHSNTYSGEMQTGPVLLQNGVILPLPGRLKLFSLKKGAPQVGDYEMEVTQDEKQPRWTYLTVLNGQVIATDERGGIVRVQLTIVAGQTSLGKAVARKLDRPVSQGMTVLDKKLIITDSSGQLHWLSSLSLTPTASHPLPEKVTNNLWSHNGYLYVETAYQRLRCFKFENNEFKQVWEKTLLSKSGLVGSPMSADGSLLIAERNGAISWIDPQNGETRKTFLLGEDINHMPRKINNEYVVLSIDGSLHRIPLQSLKKAGGKQP